MLDAGGFDARGGAAELHNESADGPFSVTGGEPSDALAVRLDRIFPSKDFAVSWTSVAPHVVDPEYVPELPASRAGRCSRNRPLTVQWEPQRS
jgi:hypothetical protein